MEQNFPACLRFVLSEEGGRSDDVRDHGGRTAFGITQKEYWADQDRRGVPHSDVWKISEEEIQNIYHQYYWNPLCPQLPTGVDLVFFDFCVNGGRSQAIKTLQRALGGIPVDGVAGARTLAAAENESPEELINNYAIWRERFYRALKQFSIYGKGWLGRNNRCKAMALSMAKNSPTIIPDTHSHKIDMAEADSVVMSDADPIHIDTSVSPKANCNETAEATISPEQAGGASAGFGSASGLINQIQDQLLPYQYTVHIIEYALLALTAVSIGFMIYGMIRRNRVKAVT